MAIRLTAAEKIEVSDAQSAIENAYEKLCDTVSEYNEAVNSDPRCDDVEYERLKDAVIDASNAYNDALDGIESIAENLRDRWEDEWNEKSERWQESDRGTSAQEFIDQWDISFDRHEPSIPTFTDDVNEDIQIEEPDEYESGSTIDDLPHAPES